MPAFTFEKISPPTHGATSPAAVNPPMKLASTKQVSAKRSRGLIVQMLDRFAVARIKREQRGIDTAAKRSLPD